LETKYSMPKKPRLTLVNATPLKVNPTATPSTLGKAGAKLWASIQDEYRISDSGGLALLTQICIAIDRADECAEVVDRDGPMIRGQNGALREHPLLKQELASRALALKYLLRLGLDVTPPRAGPGRPSGINNPTRA
jgi:P27 family predicted phage terminase small subunit